MILDELHVKSRIRREERKEEYFPLKCGILNQNFYISVSLLLGQILVKRINISSPELDSWKCEKNFKSTCGEIK